ncbi:MAG: sigma-54 dependent transcriptional regulator [Deltaproteobacteria bacterium]
MKGSILLVEDDQVLRQLLAGLLEENGYQIVTAVNGEEGLKCAEESLFDYIITDINMPVMDGVTLLKNLRKKDIKSSVLVISAHSEVENIMEAARLGAVDFIPKPFQSEDEILLRLNNVAKRKKLEADNERLQKEVEEKFTFANIVAKSPNMQTIFKMITKIADYKTSVLITGESGTGKELVAKAIHYNSNRKNMPLIDINCGGIPETLLESELFGYEKGAFTDAYRSKKGLFVEADGGTLFLDEMGELSLPLQVKLLRALQEETIRPLGGAESIKVDVRIIAATAKNLREEVTNGNFREDLYYRINVLTIEIPPLRKRKEDIPLLVDHFIQKYNKRLNLQVEKLEGESMQAFLDYPWPGNVRELENVIERAMALSDKAVLGIEYLPPEMMRYTGRPSEEFFSEGLSIKKNAKVLERQLIERALEQTGGNKTRAAEVLEISLPALLYKIKEYKVGQAPD